MAKFELKRNSLYYSDDGQDVYDANNIVSFCVETIESNPSYWYGFYDYDNNFYRVLPSGWDEMVCLKFSAIEDETLNDFEARVLNFIYHYCEVGAKLVTVATDYSCMEDMKWTNT